MVVVTDKLHGDFPPQLFVAPEGVKQDDGYENHRCPEHNRQRQMAGSRIPNGQAVIGV